jgi:hypothetical protein
MLVKGDEKERGHVAVGCITSANLLSVTLGRCINNSRVTGRA